MDLSLSLWNMIVLHSEWPDITWARLPKLDLMYVDLTSQV